MATIGPKLYLHAATTTNTGTLPGSTTQSATTPNVTATGASTNRVMDGTIGTSQTSIALTTLAQTTAQNNWFGRWMSPPLAAQTISGTGSAWGSGGATSQSNTNSAFTGSFCVVYAWRPSNGSRVGMIVDHTTSSFGGMAIGMFNAAAETWTSTGATQAVTSSVTILDGDVLVAEVWSINNQAQSKATAYTNTVFYDGTTEGSSTTSATYMIVNDNAALTLYTAVIPPPKMIKAGNVPVHRASQW